jgi:hypothetical protein
VKRRLPLLFLAFLSAGSAPLFAEVEPALSLEVGGPQKLSANLGFKLGATKADASEVGRGFFFQLQPGLGGGSVNIGFSPVSLAGWGTQAVGVVVKARLLRSWGDPWTIEPDQTFAGVEIGAAWIVKVSVGVLQRVESGAGKATVFTWSVGVGL